MARDNWTEEQITVVLYEYCRNPFGQFSATKQFVKELGKLLGRTPGPIVRKVGNLASFDPQMKARGVGGLGHTGKLDELVWNKKEFIKNINHRKLIMPKRFLPDRELLTVHFDNYRK